MMVVFFLKSKYQDAVTRLRYSVRSRYNSQRKQIILVILDPIGLVNKPNIEMSVMRFVWPNIELELVFLSNNPHWLPATKHTIAVE